MEIIETKGLGIKPNTTRFELVGNVRINEDTFTLGEVSKSGYKYNRMTLEVNCGDENKVYAQSMGGFFQENPYPIKVFIDGNVVDIPFLDRFEDRYKYNYSESDIPNYFYKKAGIEKDMNGKLNVKGFLSEYDFIKYLSECLKSGTKVRITGIVEHNYYNGEFYQQRIIQNIFLVDEEVESRAKEEIELYVTDETAKMLSDSGMVVGYTTQRLSKIDGKKIKVTYKNNGIEKTVGSKVFPIYKSYPISEDILNNKDKKELLKKYITPKDKSKVYKIALLGDIIEKPEKVSEETLKELNKHNDSIADEFALLFDSEQEEELNNRVISGNIIKKVEIKAIQIKLSENEQGERIKQVVLEELEDKDTFKSRIIELSRIIEEINKSNEEEVEEIDDEDVFHSIKETLGSESDNSDDDFVSEDDLFI